MAINVEVGIVDKSFSKAMKEINAEIQELDNTINTLNKGIDNFEDDLESVGMVNQATARKTELLTTKLKLQKEQLQKGENALEEYKNELKGLDVTTDKGRASAEKLTLAIKQQEQANNKLKTSIQNTESKLKVMNSSLKTTKTHAKEATTAIGDMGEKLKSIKWAEIGQALISVGQSMVNIGKRGVNSFLDLVEKGSEFMATQEQMNMMYDNQGDLTKTSIDNQMKLASSYGLTATQVKQGTVQLSSYLKALGFTDEMVAQIIDDNGQMFADMAAFGNTSYDDVLERVTSALQGNHTAVNELGVELGEVIINESEYAKALGKSYSQMTEQEKTLARLSVMQQMTADYSGLAAQEAESFATQSNLLKTRLQETAGVIGGQLLPLLQPLLEKVVGLVEKFSTWATNNPELCNTILMIVGAISGLLVLLGTLAVALGSILVISTALEFSFGWVALIVAAIAALVVGVVALWVNWESVSNWMAEKWNWLCQKVTEIATNIKTWVSEKWSAMCTWVSEKTNALVTAVTGFFDNFWYNVGYYLGMALSTIVQFCVNQYNQFCEWVPKAVDAVVEWFGDMKEKAKEWLDKVIDDLITWGQDMFDKGVEAGKSLVEGVGEWLSELPNKMYEWGVNAIQGFIDGVKSLIGAAGSLISGIMDGWNSGGGGASPYATNTLETLQTFRAIGEPISALAYDYATILPSLDIGNSNTLYGASAYANPSSYQSQAFLSATNNKSNKGNMDNIYNALIEQNKLLLSFIQEKKVVVNIDNQNLGSMTKDEASLQQIRFWSKL